MDWYARSNRWGKRWFIGNFTIENTAFTILIIDDNYLYQCDDGRALRPRRKLVFKRFQIHRARKTWTLGCINFFRYGRSYVSGCCKSRRSRICFGINHFSLCSFRWFLSCRSRCWLAACHETTFNRHSITDNDSSFRRTIWFRPRNRFLRIIHFTRHNYHRLCNTKRSRFSDRPCSLDGGNRYSWSTRTSSAN